MHHFLQILQPLFDRYGYLAVFMTIFLEDFGVPMPGETTLIVGSLLAARGGINIFAFAGTAWVAAVLGDNVGYAIGRFGARSAILAVGRFLFLNERKVQAAEDAFKRWGPVLVVVSRFIELLRQLNGIVAGMARMRWRRFLAFNSLGAALWVAFWSILSFKLGQGARHSAAVLRHLDLVFLILFCLTAASVIVSRLLLKRRKTPTELRS